MRVPSSWPIRARKTAWLRPAAGATLALSLALHGAVSGSQDTRGITRVPDKADELEQLYTGSHALLIGMSRYDNEAAWPRLESVPGELENVAGALRAAGFDTVRQVLNPTGADLRRAVDEFNEKYGYTAGHRLLFFFAGHGFTLDGGSRGYFVPRDAPDPQVNEAGFRRVAVSMQQVRTWAQELVARHALFAFDSCFSGTIFRTRDTLVPRRITALTARPVREFLSAGAAGETVPARSVFAQTFIRGIRGEADIDKDGYVTGTELGNFVQHEVIAYKTNQTPQFGKIRDPELDEGDIVFALPGSAVPTVPRQTAPPVAPASRAVDPSPAAAASSDRDGIIAALSSFRAAYESMDVDALRRVYPKFGDFDALRKSFADMRSIAVAMNPASAQISVRPDGTATAIAMYSVTFTGKTGRLDTFPRRATNAHFQLRQSGGSWIIEQIDYK